MLLKHGSVAMASIIALCQSSAALAVDIPASVDAGRVGQREEQKANTPKPMTVPIEQKMIPSAAQAPEGSDKLTVTLRRVRIKGMTAFTQEQMADIYEPSLGKEIPLSMIWEMAGQMTERYRAKGYFLSRVVVPPQEVSSGTVTFRVIEGYIGEIDAPTELTDHWIVQSWLDKLQSYHPLTADQMESIMLQLNDLPGIRVNAVLEPAKDKRAGKNGAVRLKLENDYKGEVHGNVQLNNSGSRYIGPYEISTRFDFSAIPLQRTRVTAVSAIPYNEMHYGSIAQQIPVFPGGNVTLSASHTVSAPGYLLRNLEVRSDATDLEVALDYQWIRQREENLNLLALLDVRTVNTDILSTPQTQDDLRILRAGGNYQITDGWEGADNINLLVSQGMDILGSSESGDALLSRNEAKPNFTKLQLDLYRTQPIMGDWSVATSASMQVASGPLFSSEEMGFGGQRFGRAYDDSEITGDHGVVGSVELRYQTVPEWLGILTQPYGFYDIGVLWNDDDTQPARVTGSSAGAGIRLMSESGIMGDLGFAFPLTREITTPLNGQRDGPRVMIQLGYIF